MFRAKDIKVPQRDIYDIQDQRRNVIGDKHKKSYDYLVEEMNKETKYERTVLKGNHCDNILNQLFFSSKNMEIIQNGLRYRVWEKSNKRFVIGRQSDTELVIIMRAIFLQHSKNGQTQIREQIEELNTITIMSMLPKVMSNIEQYIAYLDNKDRIPDPIPRSVNVSSAGTKTLRSVTSTF